MNKTQFHSHNVIYYYYSILQTTIHTGYYPLIARRLKIRGLPWCGASGHSCVDTLNVINFTRFMKLYRMGRTCWCIQLNNSKQQQQQRVTNNALLSQNCGIEGELCRTPATVSFNFLEIVLHTMTFERIEFHFYFIGNFNAGSDRQIAQAHGFYNQGFLHFCNDHLRA